MADLLDRTIQPTEGVKIFFKVITDPHSVKSVMSIQQLLQRSKNPTIKRFWKMISEKNVECYRLRGSYKSQTWTVYYCDLETPVLFYVILRQEIRISALKSLNNITKVIKSNLAKKNYQETEHLIIRIEKDEIEREIKTFTYKLDEIQKETNSSINDKNSTLHLNNFLSEKTDKIKSDHVETLRLKTGKKRAPFGNINENNKLNRLTGREWIKFTKSWYVHRPPPRKKDEVLHPAKFPESMIRGYITFFTKPGEFVLDPFLGSGSTLVASKLSNRSGIGIELSEFYASISRKRLEDLGDVIYPPIYQTGKESFWKVICGDSKKLEKFWDDMSLPSVDFCITSPPYWSQLERNTIRQKERKNQGLDTKYSDDNENDLGNISSYQDFLREQKDIFNGVYNVLKKNGYLVVITNNVFAKGRMYPLAYDTATSIANDSNCNWVLKDEKIWLQDDKALIALGVNSAWVGNRCHQYCHIFRKEG